MEPQAALANPGALGEGAASSTAGGFHGIMEQQFENHDFGAVSSDSSGGEEAGEQKAWTPNDGIPNPTVRLRAGDLQMASSPLLWLLLGGTDWSTAVLTSSGGKSSQTDMVAASESGKAEEPVKAASNEEPSAEAETARDGAEQTVDGQPRAVAFLTQVVPALVLAPEKLPPPKSDGPDPAREASGVDGQAPEAEVLPSQVEVGDRSNTGVGFIGVNGTVSVAACEPVGRPIDPTRAPEGTKDFVVPGKASGSTAAETNALARVQGSGRQNQPIPLTQMPGPPVEVAANAPEAFALRVAVQDPQSPTPQSHGDMELGLDAGMADGTSAEEALSFRPLAAEPAKGALRQQNPDPRQQESSSGSQHRGAGGEQANAPEKAETSHDSPQPAAKAGFHHFGADAGIGSAPSAVPAASSGGNPQDAPGGPAQTRAAESGPWAARVWETARRELNAPSTTAPLREIDLRLPVENQLVDIQLRERSGLLDVSVRTPDGALAKEMRADLGELVRNLESLGYDATPRSVDDGLAARLHEPSASYSGDGNTDPSRNGNTGQEAGSGHGRRQNRQQRQRYPENLPFSVEGGDGLPVSETAFQGGNNR